MKQLLVGLLALIGRVLRPLPSLEDVHRDEHERDRERRDPRGARCREGEDAPQRRARRVEHAREQAAGGGRGHLREEPEVRAAAVSSLRVFRDNQAAQEALLFARDHDPSPMVQTAARRALGEN